MSAATSKLLALSALTALSLAAAAQSPAAQAPRPTAPQSASQPASSNDGARAALAARRAAVRPADGTFGAFSYDAVGATPVLKMRASRPGLAVAEPTRAAPSEEVGALLAGGAAAPQR